MSQTTIPALPFVQERFAEFNTSLEQGNYTLAQDAFDQALKAAPDTAYRYFATRASGPLCGVLNDTGNSAKVAALLGELIEEHPHINLLCGDDPAEVDRYLELRETNIRRGLPSVALISQGKSASVSVQNVFSAGFNLPCFAYSLITLEVIESWARDFARGGACYTTHLDPQPQSAERLKRAGVSKVIVHVRDPRQRLLSMFHHLERYPNAMLQLKHGNLAELSTAEKIERMMWFYSFSVDWLRGWVNAEKEIEVLFSTFEDFVDSGMRSSNATSSSTAAPWTISTPSRRSACTTASTITSGPAGPRNGWTYFRRTRSIDYLRCCRATSSSGFSGLTDACTRRVRRQPREGPPPLSTCGAVTKSAVRKIHRFGAVRSARAPRNSRHFRRAAAEHRGIP